MARGQLYTVLRHLRRATGGLEGDRSDLHLLERFLTGRDESAFELLLWRHGPMVLSVCRRVLHNTHDAEDAFQATFLALVRKGGTISKREALAGWLYRVAYRIALRARSGSAKHQTPTQEIVDVVAPEPASTLADRELRSVLDEEVNRLPEKYRLALVLCCFEGKTIDEACRQLGRPRSTIAVRLMRARELLRARLTRRGLALSVSLSGTFLTGTAEAALVPAGLVRTTMTMVSQDLTCKATAGAAVRVASLAEGVLKAMVLSRLKVMATVVLLTVGVLGAGATLFLSRSPATQPGAGEREGRGSERPLAPNVPRQEVPSQREGILLFVGTDVPKGEKVPPERVVTVKVGGEIKKYRRLRVGDKVEEGQLLARVDDRLARDEVAIKKAKVEAAEADRRAATKTKEEAQRRYESLLKSKERAPGLVGEDELRGAKLTWDRYIEEENFKIAAVKQAQAEMRAAETIVDMHEIRSDISGVIRAIYKQKGEAVKALKPVFLIEGESKPAIPPAKERRSKNQVEVPAERDGKLMFVGTEIKPGEKVPEYQKIRATIGFLAVEVGRREEVPPEDQIVPKGSDTVYRRWREDMNLPPEKLVVFREEKEYRRLEVGDDVKEGQLLALVNPAFAVDDLAFQTAKLDAAEIERRAAVTTKEEAGKRFSSMRAPHLCVSQDDYRVAFLTWERYKEEEAAKTATVRQTQRELHRAVTILGMHEIRSTGAGVVKVIYKHRGEAVRNLEPVLQIEMSNTP